MRYFLANEMLRCAVLRRRSYRWVLLWYETSLRLYIATLLKCHDASIVEKYLWCRFDCKEKRWHFISHYLEALIISEWELKVVPLLHAFTVSSVLLKTHLKILTFYKEYYEIRQHSIPSLNA